jgi:hypothetical protein
LLGSMLAAGVVGGPPSQVSLRTIQGQILAIDHVPGEGDLDLIVTEVRVDNGSGKTERVILAPESVCRELGFRTAEGDRVRVRVFPDESGASVAQKVMNLSQGTMVRLRTLHRIPLWDSHGVWQGGPLRDDRGPHRHGGGAGKRRNR